MIMYMYICIDAARAQQYSRTVHCTMVQKGNIAYEGIKIISV